jgi:hypothetical protein
MRFWLTTLLLTSALHGGAQSLQGTVMNPFTNAPVPHVLVTSPDRKIGVRTNGEGVFTFPTAYDTLLFSAPGFQSARIPVDSGSLIVPLAETQLVIQGIPFQYTSRPEVVVEGMQHKNSQGQFAPCDSTAFQEMALLIPNPGNQRAILHKLYYFIERKERQRSPFRVRIYKNQDGKPGADLLDESVVVRPRWWRRWKEVRVGSYNIVVPPEGFFVAMEWLHTPASRYPTPTTEGHEPAQECYGPVLGLSDELSELRGWTRANGGTWLPWGRNQPDTKLNPMMRAEWLRYR